SGSSRLTAQYGEKPTFGPDPQLKATGIAMVCASLAWHLGHLAIRCMARMAPPKSRNPAIGIAARGMPSGRPLATAPPKANKRQPPIAAAADHHTRRLM